MSKTPSWRTPPDPDGPRAVDRSEPDHTGSPRRMQATCFNCGARSKGGCVTVWFNVEDGKSVPRDDVSFKCRECGDVADQKIEVLERWPGDVGE